MKNIKIRLIGFGQDVVIKGDEWYMLSLEQSGLYFYGCVLRSGVDYNTSHDGKLTVIGVDADGY